jgi:hypothetical protein
VEAAVRVKSEIAECGGQSGNDDDNAMVCHLDFNVTHVLQPLQDLQHKKNSDKEAASSIRIKLLSLVG